jgi:PAS domain S-box-containing protein
MVEIRPGHSPQLEDAAFRRLAELSPEPMLAHAGVRIVWANAAAAAVVGLERPEEAYGRSVLEFVDPASRRQTEARVARMLATGQPEPLVEQTLLRADGSTRIDAEVTSAPIGDGVILVVFRDIAPRRRAERQRLEATRRWRAFFESTSDAIGVSLRGVHVEVNAAYARLFGYERPEELAGRPVLDLVAPSDRPRIAENVRRRAAGEPLPTVYQVRSLRRDGTEFLMELRVSMVPEGEADQTVVMVRDVTAEREHEARLAASEARYRELFDQVPVGVWEEDLSGAKRILDGLRATGVTDLAAHLRAHPEVVAACAMAVRILDVNATVLAMVGARDEAELLQNLHRVFLPESMEDFAAELLQLVEGRRETLTEGWNGTLDGRRVWVAVRAVLAEGHEHDWSRVLVTTVDVTERRQASQERALLQERLRHAEKLEAVGRLAGGVAHDFNNVLSAILGFAEASLEETTPGTALHENQLHVRAAARRARDLVRQILTFGRRDRPEPKPVDVAAVVGEALALARAAVPAGVTVEARLDPAAGSALADPTQLHQIVLNLCSNARDAVGERGRIEVAVEPVRLDAGEPELPAGAWIRLRVRDDGVGMDEATRARLFEPYMTTKGRSGGHGLGLAVVHGIVTGCGGAVRVESAPGLGSTFDVWLPRLDGPARAAAAPATAVRGHGRVLLVDDEPLVRSAHGRLLRSLGYEVTEAADGAEALERLRAAPEAWDVVLTDQTMPRLSGAELARAWLAERPGARVILCTGYSDAVDEARARELGLQALLAKPIDRADLAAAVQRALAGAAAAP